MPLYTSDALHANQYCFLTLNLPVIFLLLFSLAVIMAGRATRSAKPSSQHKEHQPRAKWTSALNKLLVEVIIDQVQRVSGQQHCFGKVPWKQICEEFYNKTSHVWDKEQLKYRYSLLRRQYVTVKSMLELNDFSWDESTGQISATKETWDNYIKVNFSIASLEMK